MPLKPGLKNFQSNIKELIKNGYQPKQATAIAYSEIKRTKGK